MSSSEMENDLIFLWEPVGKKSQATIRVLDGDRLIDHDTIDLAKTSKRTEFSKRIVERFGSNVEYCEAQLLRINHERHKANETKKDSPPEDDLAEQTRRAIEETDPDVLEEAERLLIDPWIVTRITTDLESAGIAGEEDLSLLLYLIGTSRLLPRPLAAIVQGQSSSGKSYTIERVAGMFPAEAIVWATTMTPQALFHAKPGSLSHRWVVAGERSRVDNDDRAEATRALREMLAAGRLSKLMPMKVGGEIVTVTIEQPGPIAFVESTTSARVFEEDANRCIMLSTDERRAQTETIMRRLALHASGKVRSEGPRVVTLHQTLQRLLQRRDIVVPFAERLADLFEVFAERVECRRAFPMLLSLIQASALLHQRQRQTDNQGRLIAAARDYEISAKLLCGSLSRTLGECLSDPAQRFLDRLLAEIDDPIYPMQIPFNAAEIRGRLKAGRSTVAGFLTELEDKQFLELVEVVPLGRGRPSKAWKPTDRVVDAEDVLPSMEDVFAKRDAEA